MSKLSSRASGYPASLRPDIDVTRRAIERVVASLSSDPAEREAIVSAAAAAALASLRHPS